MVLLVAAVAAPLCGSFPRKRLGNYPKGMDSAGCSVLSL